MIHPPKQALVVQKMLEDAGFACYFVGGCVRNGLLGLASDDWDLCTNATPDEIKRCFSDFSLVLTGEKHGTVGVKMGGEMYEITTYRGESGYEDRRHPSAVVFLRDLKDDLARRDFTVNAMAYHPREGLKDYFGGQEDLRRGVLRCVGDADKRFGEDALRILRGLRFASVYGLTPSEETARAIIKNKDLLNFIAPERIWAELKKLLTGRHAGAVLQAFYPVVAVCVPGLAVPAKEWEKICTQIDTAPADTTVRLALLLAGTDEEKIQSALAYLTVGKKEAAAVREIATRLQSPPPTGREALLFLLKEIGGETAKKLYACFLAHNPGNKELLANDQALKELEQTGCYRTSQLAIGGEELLAIGLTGPQVGRVLEELLKLVITGGAQNTRKGLLAAAEFLQKEQA